MDGFIEQVVKRVNKPKNLIIKILSVLILFLVPVICTILAYRVTPYLIYVGFFLFLIGIYIVWYVFSCQRVEYEYSVVGDEIDIARVVSKRKRKRVCKVKISELDKLDKGEKSIEGMRFSKTYIAAGDIDKAQDNYYAVFNSAALGRCLIIFSPNEKILLGMKPHLNKSIVLKLFYHRSAG